MVKVSVIVPVYNLDKYIDDTIKSVKEQTMQDWELILIDDASTDGSLSILKRYECEDSRIKVITNPENKGPMYAREQGCKIAQGEYITFCDGDDRLSNNAIEVLYNAAKQENADIVVGQIMKIYPDGKCEPFQVPAAALKYGNGREAFFKSVLRREIHQGVAGKIYHQNIVKKANLTIFEHCTNSEDAAVLFQYIRLCNVVCVISDFVYLYYQRKDSSTHIRLSKVQVEGICKTTRLRLQILNNYPDLHDDVMRYFSENLVGLMRFNHNGVVSRLLKKYKIDVFVSMSFIIKLFGIKDIIKLFIQIYIVPLLLSIKKS